MTAPSKTTKAKRQPVCKHCKKRFRTTSAIKIYCTQACQQQATKVKRRVNRVDRAMHSGFFYCLAYECERAGTLQILTGHTVDSLVALHEVYKLKLKANQYGQIKDFEISHIYPSKGHDSIGLYHAENLVVAPTHLNRAHGTKHYGGGLSISRTALVSKHKVEKGTPRKQTVERIIKFLGEDVVAEVVKVAKIQSTQRHALTSWLQDRLDPTVPEHHDHLDSLDGMTTQALRALKATLKGKEASGFKIRTTTYTALNVLFLELQRHSGYRPELSQVLDVICAVVHPRVAIGTPRALLNEQELQAVFDVLHGKPISAIQEALTEFTERYTSVMDHGERIPAYKPIVFTVKPKPASKPALVALKTFRSFVDELDGYAEDTPLPVRRVHAVTHEMEDPLPWDR